MTAKREIRVVPYGTPDDARWRVEQVNERGIRSFLDYGLTTPDAAETSARDAAAHMGYDLNDAIPVPARRGHTGEKRWILTMPF